MQPNTHPPKGKIEFMKTQNTSFSMKKVLNILLFIIFSLFAALQLNDRDGWIWFIVYGIVAIIHLYAAFKTLNQMLIWVLVLGLSIYCIFHIPYLIEWMQVEDKSEIFGEMVYEKPYLEGTREFLGLLIAIIALSFKLKRKK